MLGSYLRPCQLEGLGWGLEGSIYTEHARLLSQSLSIEGTHVKMVRLRMGEWETYTDRFGGGRIFCYICVSVHREQARPTWISEWG